MPDRTNWKFDLQSIFLDVESQREHPSPIHLAIGIGHKLRVGNNPAESVQP